MLPSRRAYTLNEDRSRSIPFNRGMIAETGIIPAGMQLIRDTWSFDVVDRKTVTEGVNSGGLPVMKVSGLIQKGDNENANQRFYSTREVLQPAVRNIQEDIGNRAVMGEFDHPPDAKIHLDRVSHLMTKVWMEGQKVFGEAEVLHSQPCGACLRGLFENKVRVGISSRGVGDMEVSEHKGHQVYRVMPGYSFVTWDVVAEPSVNGAILQIQEGLTRRLRPIKESRNQFSPEVYNNLLVREIENFFGLKKQTRVAIPRSIRK